MNVFFRKALTWVITRLSGKAITWKDFLRYYEIVRDVALIIPKFRSDSSEAEAAKNLKRRSEALQRLRAAFPEETESNTEWLMLTALKVFKSIKKGAA